MPAGSPGTWRDAGDRIDGLLDAMSASGPIARERAETLVREVVGLYGAGLEQILRVIGEHDGGVILRKIADDDLVASLLLVHGLHPDDVEARVRKALDSVRPYLGSHGGDVDLIGVDEGVVRLRFQGTCKSCPSSSVTLELAVEDAVRSAAPEITDIQVETEDRSGDGSSGLIAPDTLFAKVHQNGSDHNGPHHAGSWAELPELEGLADGEVAGFAVGGTTILACRVGEEAYAFIDRCGHCLGSMAGAVLHRQAGTRTAVLRCPRCRAHFDIGRAGASIDDTSSEHGGEHLTPLPVLRREGVLSVSVPAGAGQ
ncbi:NifU family protein [Hoyosella sp. G463]|uniref:NifU family protein n=1 Tax=Lolliginicoccus lacisalsi TaxID=2742202 RepID=A0A927J9Q0_9ACTN|nr:NifU family protein [Lolliginicoccus lacisalsi]MBD8505081.1 NifU family protein [Lolliginicoccus lacisalsi]